MSSQGTHLSPVDASGQSLRREVHVVAKPSGKVLVLDDTVAIERRDDRLVFVTPDGRTYPTTDWKGLCFEGLAEVREKREGDNPQLMADLAKNS